MTKPPVPAVCLVILDGWGLADAGPGNAVEQADTPVFDELWSTHPHSTLTACGTAVGLPEGQMGNSEVGHLNLGAGSIVPQDLKRIDDAVADGSFFENEVLREACAAGCEAGRLHLLGLVSAGGVHASMDHLKALIELAARQEVPDLVVHVFTDGRDTLPDSGAGYVAQVEEWLAEHGGRVATVTGRYYAMDRDKREERTEMAHDALVKGEAEGRYADTAEAAVNAAYERDETDEFVKPTLVGGGGGQDPRWRRRDLLQLPARPGAAAHRGPGPSGSPPRHPHPVPGVLRPPGRLPAQAPRGDPRRGAFRARHFAASRGRDREIRACDLLLQRR